MAPPGTRPEDVGRGWRRWIGSRTYLHDRPLVSVLVYAVSLRAPAGGSAADRNGKPPYGAEPTLPGLE